MKVFILQPEPSPARRNCLNFIQRCPDGMTVEVKESKAKRSSQANRRYWAILQQIADDAWMEGRQYAADPVWHDFFKRRFIGVIDGPCGTSSAESTTKLNTKEFAQYVEKVEVFAATELGICLVEDIKPTGRMCA